MGVVYWQDVDSLLQLVPWDEVTAIKPAPSGCPLRTQDLILCE